MTRRTKLAAGGGRRARRTLAGAGLAVSAGLITVALLGFEDAGALAQLRLEREARGVARAAELAWGSGVGKQLLDGDSGRLAWSRRPELEVAVPSPARSAADDASRIPLLLARAAAARGDRAEALSALARTQDGLFLRSEESLLVNASVRREIDALEGLPDAWRTLAPRAGYQVTRDGVPVRLLAVLTAGDDLPIELRRAERDALEEAMARGRVALPAPVDMADVAGDSVEVELDPTWSALAALLEERSPLASEPGWRDALAEEDRSRRAILRFVEDALGPEVARRTVVQDLGGDRWLVGQPEGDPDVRFAVLTGAELDRALRAHLSDLGGGLVASLFGEAPGQPLAESSLTGFDRPLIVSHPEAPRIRREAALRQRTLRAGLVLVSLMIAAATALAVRAWRRADELAALRTTFVASVSHDLRTPVTSIGLLTETLREGHAAGREDHYLETIEREAARLRRLVDDLLDFGRLERGLGVHVRPAEVDLGPWLRGFAERERARCREKDVALALEVEGLAGTAVVDASAVERALSNLVDNALAHAAPSRITLSARPGADGAIEFAVTDDGRGIPRARLSEDLFEPFHRGGTTGGTGLGLAIVRAIADGHGGGAAMSGGPDGSGLRVTLRILPGGAAPTDAGESAA